MFKPLSIRYGGVDLRFALLFYVGGALLQLDLKAVSLIIMFSSQRDHELNLLQ